MKSSFGFYETMRIILPGFYFASLLFLYWGFFLRLLLPVEIGPFLVLVIFILVVLLSGLTMYAQESTKRRRAFQENQPSTYIQTKARMLSDIEPLSDDETRKFYFYLLNTVIPAAFHDKIFFFGTVYHIMIHIRRTSLWFGCFFLGSIVAALTVHYPLEYLLGLAILTFMVWGVYLLNVRYNKADRKMQENYQDQVYWLSMNDDLVQELLRKRGKANV
jgi:membrane protein implicated in regulation of membrane protease activity